MSQLKYIIICLICSVIVHISACTASTVESASSTSASSGSSSSVSSSTVSKSSTTAAEGASRDTPEKGVGNTQQETVIADKAMVVAANPLATEAGLKILKKGGSVIDAAIAVQAMLTLVEPQSSGIGGGAFILLHDGTQLFAYDGRETAPAKATANLFLNEKGQPDPWIKAVVGGRSVGVPGVLRALELAHRQHGKLPWNVLFADAIKASENGFIVSPRFAQLVKSGFNPGLKQLSPAKEYFYPDGTAVKAGSLLKNPELAKTLKLIADQGAKVFYTGSLAQNIVKAVRNSPIAPGVLSMADLADYQAKERKPVCTQYKHLDVCSMPPPSSGGIAVLQQLELLEPLTLEFDREPALKSLHFITQAARLAYADRDRYVADSDFVDVPLQQLLDKNYLAQRRELIQPDRDMGKAVPGLSPKLGLADNDAYELPSTSHFSIVDTDGNALSMTSSIEMAYGSAVMTDGFLLNNQLTDFALSPRRDGKLVANRVEPGKRPRSSMAPVIVLQEDTPVLLLGSPGGSNIINYVTQTLLGVIDWDLSLQQSIEMPKISNRNSNTALEKGTYMEQFKFPLEAMGHQIQIRGLNSGLHGIERTREGWRSGTDPRREGKAMGF